MASGLGKRTLVRWNDDHDKELLLWMVYCCNEQGIKIPYQRIAQCLGPSFTEGAIVQHLAKVRVKMEAAGLHVPPVQKRGTVTRTASSIYRPTPKPLDAPVPRARPVSHPIAYVDRSDDAEKKEEQDGDEEKKAKPQQQQQRSPPIRHSTRKSSKRQSASRKTTRAIKQESEDDSPDLYDSDKEYGAKNLGSKKNSPGQAKKQDDLLDYSQTDLDHTDSQSVQMSQLPGGNDMMLDSSEIFPGADQYNLALNESYGPTTTKATRRKSSAMDADEGSDADYDPSGTAKSKGRAKKGRAGKANKKQKVDKSRESVSDPAAGTAYQENVDYNADRVAMPPPAFPGPMENAQVHWNNRFMAQPFADHNGHFPYLGGMTANNGSHNLDFDPGFDNLHLNTAAYPGAGYHIEAAAPVVSGANSRNDSFASASSGSTLESQPGMWNQPLRSSGFPNPQEASRVLHEALQNPGMDGSTHINIFGVPPQDYGMGSQNGFDSIFKCNEDAKPEATDNDPNSMFVGTPEEQHDDQVDISAFFDDSMIGHDAA